MENWIGSTLYAEYIREREGAQVYESPSAFVTFKIAGEECLITNLYVKPEMRRGIVGVRFMASFMAHAMSLGAKKFFGIIRMNDAHKERMLSLALRVGFKIVETDTSMIVVGKEE